MLFSRIAEEYRGPRSISDSELKCLCVQFLTQFDQYVKLNKKIPPEILILWQQLMMQAVWQILWQHI